MQVCCCALAGTRACYNCPNSPFYPPPIWYQPPIYPPEQPHGDPIEKLQKLREKMQPGPSELDRLRMRVDELEKLLTKPPEEE